MYIRAGDLLLKFPYKSTTFGKLRDTVKGLLVLYSILNLEPKEFYTYMDPRGELNLEGLKPYGWAHAMKTAKASYSTDLLIEKPGRGNGFPASHTTVRVL